MNKNEIDQIHVNEKKQTVENVIEELTESFKVVGDICMNL